MNKLALAGGLLVVIAIAVFSTAFVVNERDQCFITQFGRPVGQPITEPGIHFKIPFLQMAHFYSRQFLEWDGNPEEVTTKDKKFIAIDTYARWRIQDPLLFFQQVTDELGAQTRLDDILDGATRRVVAANNLVEIVRSKKRDVVDPASEEGIEIAMLQSFENGRHRIAQEILETARPTLAVLGIELLDLRFKRIMYGPAVQNEIFNRMKAERNRIADKFRSEGQGEAQKIDGERSRELSTIQSLAYKQAEEIRGSADAQAIAIYAEAYDQSRDAREFYRFLKTMETYERSFTNTDSLILSTDSDLYRYFSGGLEDSHSDTP